MAYELLVVTPEVEEKIMKDMESDNKKKRRLAMRGGHFNRNPGLPIAVSGEMMSYLFYAPKLAAMSLDYRYFFFFQGRFYELNLLSYATGVIEFKDPIDNFLIGALKEELVKAFEVYGILGKGPSLNVIFSE